MYNPALFVFVSVIREDYRQVMNVNESICMLEWRQQMIFTPRGARPVTCNMSRDLQIRGAAFKLRDPEIIVIAVKYVSYNTKKKIPVTTVSER